MKKQKAKVLHVECVTLKAAIEFEREAKRLGLSVRRARKIVEIDI